MARLDPYGSFDIGLPAIQLYYSNRMKRALVTCIEDPIELKDDIKWMKRVIDQATQEKEFREATTYFRMLQRGLPTKSKQKAAHAFIEARPEGIYYIATLAILIEFTGNPLPPEKKWDTVAEWMDRTLNQRALEQIPSLFRKYSLDQIVFGDELMRHQIRRLNLPELRAPF